MQANGLWAGDRKIRMPDSYQFDIASDSLKRLELPAVLEEVAAHAMSIPGQEAVLASRPEEDLASVEQSLFLVAQVRELVTLEGRLGLGDLVPVDDLLARIGNPATILDAAEIFIIGDLITMTRHIWARLGDLGDRFGLLRSLSDSLAPLPALERAIQRVLDERGMVRSDASPRLAGIRDRMRSVRSRILTRLEGIVSDQEVARIVQEDYVTLRNDRYVILLRPEFKGLLDGIVHDHSRSGHSVYVEPFSVVEANNEMASVLDEERGEVLRVFKELSEEIRSVRDVIHANYQALTRLDALQARGLYAEATRSVVPELTDRGFRILGARHPLLIASPDVDVVPMDLIKDASTAGTVISGPNMGGKTVALKIAGLFPLMARCGILLPAQEGTRIQPFARIMADIGDEQNIRGRVSSFSGHIMRIGAILEQVRDGDLVLLDELGSATDPDEGSALAMAIMDELTARGALVVVTTHLTYLKAYAMGREKMKNISVEFHPATMKPTFRLLYDLPGESHAILTAERIGLPPQVIAAARTYTDKAVGGTSRLMQDLREKLTEVESLRESLRAKERGLEEELAQIRTEREDVVETFRQEARELLGSAERRLMDLHHSVKSGKTRGPRNIKEALDGVRSQIVNGLGTPLERQVPVPDIGTRVKVKALNQDGILKAVLDRGRTVEVAIGTITVRADVEDVVPVTRQPMEEIAFKTERLGVEIPLAAPRWEVNVIGLRVDEAIPIVERAVDEAVLGGLASMTVIHGKGTGRLKKAIWDHLSGHALVRAFRAGDIHGGGEGVTCVDLVVD